MASSVVSRVAVQDDDTVVIEVHHTMGASFSRSVDVVANRQMRNHARKAGWRSVSMSADYGVSTDYTREPHICTSFITYKRTA